MSLIPVEGSPNLFRDEKTGAIINCDENAYNQYVNSLMNRQHQKKEIEILKDEVSEIKTLLRELINGSKQN
jgi:hypothetical protein